MTACPYCHRDEKGEPMTMDTAAVEVPGIDRYFENDLKDLASEDLFARDQAVIRVAQRGFGVVQALNSILSDFAKPGLAGVAAALGRIGDRRSIPFLAQAAKLGDEDLRIAAVWALAQFHEPEVLPSLMSESERAHPMIQSFLASVLGTFQDARVVPVLAKLSVHSHREVAFQAVNALGEIGDRAALPVLQKSWRHGEPLVRAASAASIRRLGGRPSWISPRIVTIGIVCLVAVGMVAWIVYK